MALANVAALLSRYGRKVLMIDWDLEAPGLEKFFGRYVQGSRTNTPGLLDLVGSYKEEGTHLDWRRCLLTVAIPQAERISLLHAGKDTPEYLERLRTLDWDELFREHNLGRVLDGLRDEWISEYDVVLIDSRTGITDIGGICSILMPEYLVCFFTTNEQSLKGVRDTMVRASRAHADLPLDRRRLVVIPIPARDESNTEYNLAAEWRRTFARELGDFYRDWIPRGETAERVLDFLKIPYIAYWSFGEKLPVLEEETDNPKKLAFSYAVVARLIGSRLDWEEVKQGRQAAEAQAAQRAEVEVRAAEAARIREEAHSKRLDIERREAEAEEQRGQVLSIQVEGRCKELQARQHRKARAWRSFAALFATLTFIGLGLITAIYASNRFALSLAAYLTVTPTTDALSQSPYPVVSSTDAGKTTYFPPDPSTRMGTESTSGDPLLAVKVILEVLAAGFGSGGYLAWLKMRRSVLAIQALEREQVSFTVRSGIYSVSGTVAAAQAFASRIEAIAAAADSRVAWAAWRRSQLETAVVGASSQAVSAAVEGPFSPIEAVPARSPLPNQSPAPRVPAPASINPVEAVPARDPLPNQPLPRPAPAPMAAPIFASSAAPDTTGTDAPSGPIDVILSYVPSSLTQAWLREFRPIFDSWLAEYLGRAPAVAWPDLKWFDQPEAGSLAAVSLVIVSRTYMKSDWAKVQFQWLYRNLGSSRIFPIALDRNVELSSELREIVLSDFTDFAFVGEGFAKTERYVDFQAKVRELANAVADRIEKVHMQMVA